MFVVLPREKLFLLKKQNEFLGFSSKSYIKVNYSRGFVIEWYGMYYGSIALLWHNAKVLALFKVKWEIH